MAPSRRHTFVVWLRQALYLNDDFMGTELIPIWFLQILVLLFSLAARLILFKINKIDIYRKSARWVLFFAGLLVLPTFIYAVDIPAFLLISLAIFALSWLTLTFRINNKSTIKNDA